MQVIENDQALAAGRGVAADDVGAVALAGQADAGVQLVDVLDGEALRDAQRHRQLARRAAHGADVADVYYGGLVAQVLEGHVGEVEVHALEQKVGGDQHVALAVAKDGGVVADGVFGGVVGPWQVVGEAVDEAELAQCGYFSHVFSGSSKTGDLKRIF